MYYEDTSGSNEPPEFYECNECGAIMHQRIDRQNNPYMEPREKGPSSCPVCEAPLLRIEMTEKVVYTVTDYTRTAAGLVYASRGEQKDREVVNGSVRVYCEKEDCHFELES